MTRVIVNASKDQSGSKNWKLDWAKANNQSYAWVLKQKHFPKVIDKNQHVKKVGNNVKKFSKIVKAICITKQGRTNETQHLKSSHKITQVTKCVPKVSIDDRLPTHNRFAILNSIDNTECVVNNVEKIVDRLSGQFVDCKYDISDAVNTSLLCNDSKRLQ